VGTENLNTVQLNEICGRNSDAGADLVPSTSVSPCHCHFTDVSYLFTLIPGLTEGQAGEIWETSNEAMTFRLSENSGQKVVLFSDASDT
jgi:hypothetical protein